MPKIQKDNHTVNEKHKTYTKSNNKITISRCPGNIGDSFDIITKSIVTDPHIDDIKPKWQANNSNKQENRPKPCMSGQFEGDDKNYTRVNSNAHKPPVAVHTRGVYRSLTNYEERYYRY